MTYSLAQAVNIKNIFIYTYKFYHQLYFVKFNVTNYNCANKVLNRCIFLCSLWFSSLSFSPSFYSC